MKAILDSCKEEAPRMRSSIQKNTGRGLVPEGHPRHRHRARENVRYGTEGGSAGLRTVEAPGQQYYRKYFYTMAKQM